MPPPDLTIEAALVEFRADLRIDKSPKTIETYTDATYRFHKWLISTGCETPTLRATTSDQVRDWLLVLRDAGRTESTLYNRFNGLRAFFSWALVEGLVDENPVRAVPAPKPKENPVPVLSVDDLRAMLRTCNRTFEGTRDEALIRLLADTGMRRGGCAGLRVADLDFEQDTATITLKGGRVQVCPFGPRTAKALRRYLRVRAGHDYAGERNLWIGRRGPINANAVLLIVRRRARQAGIEGRVFVHQFRHTWAHEALRSGLQEGDVMRLGGWRSREMLSRYGSAGADARAKANYLPVSLGDKL